LIAQLKLEVLDPRNDRLWIQNPWKIGLYLFNLRFLFLSHLWASISAKKPHEYPTHHNTMLKWGDSTQLQLGAGCISPHPGTSIKRRFDLSEDISAGTSLQLQQRGYLWCLSTYLSTRPSISTIYSAI
jgi:hypothetical protein